MKTPYKYKHENTSCAGKIKHAGPAKAKAHARRLNKNGKRLKNQGTRVSEYKCPYCDYWHVGHGHRKEKGK